MPDEQQRILIVTEDALSQRMAGPAIRAWNIAEVLGLQGHDVVLATLASTCERSSASFRVEAADPGRVSELERWCTVVIVQGFVLERVPALTATEKVMVVDLYDPLHLEQLEHARHVPEPERSNNYANVVRVLQDQLARGDFFICASEKQRDLWLGFLSAVGRVNPATHALDPTLRRLIDVVAFGLSPDPPVHARPALRGVVPGIGVDDEIVLWGGGVYDWLDPLTAIRAVDRLRRQRPKIRLFFLGVRHPNPVIEEPPTLRAARALAHDLGIDGSHVFFNEDWVPYEDRASFLLEADVAISLHVEHAETAYSFRTRVLDYLWAGLPIVATQGDTFADLIERERLGAVVPGEDEGAVAGALSGLLADVAERAAIRDRARAVARRFVWSEVLQPLVAFCALPSRAADAASPARRPARRPAASAGARASAAEGGAAVIAAARRGIVAYRRGGLGAVVEGVRRAASRALRRARA